MMAVRPALVALLAAGSDRAPEQSALPQTAADVATATSCPSPPAGRVHITGGTFIMGALSEQMHRLVVN